MLKLTGTGALIALFALALAAGCVSGFTGNSSTGVTDSVPAIYSPAAPAVTATPAPESRELSELALTRQDMPFNVADMRGEERTVEPGSGDMAKFGAIRMYQAGFTNGINGPSTWGVLQIIMEVPADMPDSFTYVYEQMTNVSAYGNRLRLLEDPGIGDRSFAFEVKQGSGTSGTTTITGVMFTKANVMEMIVLMSPGDNPAALATLAKKAAARIPDGGIAAPPVPAATLSGTAVPTTTPATASVSRTPAKAPKGLLVWYDFEDDFVSTRVVKDRSGSGRDGAVIGTVAGSDGVRGTKGIAFSGMGCILTTDNPAAGKKAVTFSFWFRTADPTRNYKFASAAEWRGGPGTGWTMATHRPEFWADDGPEDLLIPGQPNTDNGFLPDVWTHEVVVYDGKTMKEYTNGTLINNWEGRNVPMSKGVPMAVGGWPQFSGYNYAGQMDDFRIYDRALSAQEIAGLYRESRS